MPANPRRRPRWRTPSAARSRSTARPTTVSRRCSRRRCPDSSRSVPMRIRARTRLLAVVGAPIAHSLAPRMQNAAIAALGLDAVYVALETCPDTLELVVRGVLATGGAVNVTVPHKRAVVPLLDDPSEVVRRTGACNTVWAGLRGISGENTDVLAIRLEAARLLGGRPMRRALVVGTGGSARAAAAALAEEWPEAPVAILSRDAARAEEFLAWAAGSGIRAEPVGG